MSAPASPSFRPLVLAVDDYQPNLVVLCALLETVGVDVMTASTAFEAMALAREHAFALILMDVRMPTLTGTEVAALIRKGSLNSHTPVVFLTGDEDICLALRRQGQDVVEKPYSPSMLLDKVEAIVSAPRAEKATQRAH